MVGRGALSAWFPNRARYHRHLKKFWSWYRGDVQSSVGKPVWVQISWVILVVYVYNLSRVISSWVLPKGRRILNIPISVFSLITLGNKKTKGAFIWISRFENVERDSPDTQIFVSTRVVRGGGWNHDFCLLSFQTTMHKTVASLERSGEYSWIEWTLLPSLIPVPYTHLTLPTIYSV